MTLTNLQRDRGMCISFFEPAGVASKQRHGSGALFLASLRFCVRYYIDRDTVRKTCVVFLVGLSITNLKMNKLHVAFPTSEYHKGTVNFP